MQDDVPTRDSEDSTGAMNRSTFVHEVLESAGSSRMEGLDGNAIDDMIEIAKKIAHDYEHRFERTKDEKACGECGYRLYCGD